MHKKDNMGTLAISNKVLDKYFGFLKNLDIKSKKKLIIKLEESLESNLDNNFELINIFGAWEDNKNSDKIIKEIKTSRVEKSIPENF